MALLQRDWSPDAIQGWLQLPRKNRPDMQLSAEMIYQWVYQDAAAGGRLYCRLHSQHKQRKKQRQGGLKRVLIPNRIGIEQRPESIMLRKRLGHWEGDTVEGAKGTGGVATHVERKSRYLVVYISAPYSPWQRGTNEQTNGLLRRYFPKGCNFRKVSEQHLQQVVTLINQRPRKSLNYRTPEEVFFKAVGGAL